MPKLKLTVQNNSGYQDDQVFIGFRPAAAPPMDIVNLKDGTTIQSIYDTDSGTWYKLSELAAGVDVSTFSGRVYVCYDTPWTPQGDGYEPAQTPSDPNFYLRYDKMEFTFTGNPADVADLTSIDYWAIPMTLETYMDPDDNSPVQTSQGLCHGATAQSVFDKLKALTTPPQSGLSYQPPGGGTPVNPKPAVVPGDFGADDQGAKPFARVIGPSAYPDAFPSFRMGMPITPYQLFEPYLVHLWQTFGPATKADKVVEGLGAGVIAKIKGTFHGVGPNVPPSGPKARQDYDYTAYISDNLDIQLKRSSSSANDNGQAELLCYRRGDILNPGGAYGGNSPYYESCANPIMPQNDLNGWLTGDLFSGLNIGAIGSTVTHQEAPVGGLPSQTWFKLPLSMLFAGLQPDHTYYNPWAYTMSPLSDAYNFAYSDRFDSVQVSLNTATVNRLEIVLEDATVDTSK